LFNVSEDVRRGTDLIEDVASPRHIVAPSASSRVSRVFRYAQSIIQKVKPSLLPLHLGSISLVPLQEPSAVRLTTALGESTLFSIRVASVFRRVCESLVVKARAEFLTPPVLALE
jgi:hypothetical protein